MAACVGVLLLWFVVVMIGAAIGELKGRPLLGAFLSFLVGPLGWLVVAVLPSAEHGPLCPYCGGITVPGARVCKNCGRDLPAPPPPIAVQAAVQRPWSKRDRSAVVLLVGVGVVLLAVIGLISVWLGPGRRTPSSAGAVPTLLGPSPNYRFRGDVLVYPNGNKSDPLVVVATEPRWFPAICIYARSKESPDALYKSILDLIFVDRARLVADDVKVRRLGSTMIGHAEFAKIEIQSGLLAGKTFWTPSYFLTTDAGGGTPDDFRSRFLSQCIVDAFALGEPSMPPGAIEDYKLLRDSMTGEGSIAQDVTLPPRTTELAPSTAVAAPLARAPSAVVEAPRAPAAVQGGMPTAVLTEPHKTALDRAAEPGRQRTAERQAREEATRKDEGDRQRAAHNAVWVSERRPLFVAAIKKLADAATEMNRRNPDAAWACAVGQAVYDRLAEATINLRSALDGAEALEALRRALTYCSPRTASWVITNYAQAGSALQRLLDLAPEPR